MKKRLFASLLSLALIAAMVPAAWATEETYEISTSNDMTLSGAVASVNAGGSVIIKLGVDEEISRQIFIDGTRNIILDLNGHTLTKTEADEKFDAVFRIETGGNLTITDNSADRRGTILGADCRKAGSGKGDDTSLIAVVGGTLNLTGGTLTGNLSNGNGGAVYVSNGTFNMSGGTISNNTAAEGGGIYATGNSTVTISGGTISGNTATSMDMFNNESSPAGGGGIAIVGGDGYTIGLKMTGGTIINNTAEGAGGGIGIRKGYYTCMPTFEMTGGSIVNNTAETAEGGGIRIEGNGEINPTHRNIFITGNKCNSTRDLGGGGIFVVNSGTTTIHNAIITNNEAGGLGGGIAGCIHGEIIDMSTATQGAAIYGNKASGLHYTGDKVADNAENVNTGLTGYAASEVAADLFSAGARASVETDRGAMVVSDRMPGGGSHSWSGVDGGTEVSIAPGSAYHSKDFLVLTANPSEEDIESANEALSDGMVLISDNYARNHGGGIAVNGILEFSSAEDQYIMDVEAEVNATKKLLQKNTVTKYETPLEDGMAGYTFEIATEKTGGDVICTADSDEDGSVNLVIPADVFTTNETEYTFYLREQKGNDSYVTYYDPAVYTVSIELTEDRQETIQIGTSTITKYTYTAVVSITQTTEDGEEVSVGEPTFTNKINYTPGGDSVAISGRKEVPTGAPDIAFRFQLLDSDGDVLDTKELTGDGSFTFDPIAYNPARDEPGTYTYTVVEERGSASGWTYDSTRYTVTVKVTADDEGNLSANAPYITVNEESQGEIVFQNSYNPGGGGGGGSTTVDVTAEKRWVLDDGGVRPDSVTVELLQNGNPTDRTAVLNAENGWSYRWTNLSDSYNWTVREVNVPDGFAVSYQQRGNTIIITNDDIPDEPEEPDIPEEPDTPDTPDEPDTPDTPDEPDTPDTPDEPDTPDTPDTPSDPGVPQTSDGSLTGLWLALCMLSLGCLGLLRFTASGRGRRTRR